MGSVHHQFFLKGRKKRKRKKKRKKKVSEVKTFKKKKKKKIKIKADPKVNKNYIYIYNFPLPPPPPPISFKDSNIQSKDPSCRHSNRVVKCRQLASTKSEQNGPMYSTVNNLPHGMHAGACSPSSKKDCLK